MICVGHNVVDFRLKLLVPSQVSGVITAGVSLDETENPGLHLTNFVAQPQLSIINYSEVQISIVTAPLAGFNYFQILND